MSVLLSMLFYLALLSVLYNFAMLLVPCQGCLYSILCSDVCVVVYVVLPCPVVCIVVCVVLPCPVVCIVLP